MKHLWAGIILGILSFNTAFSQIPIAGDSTAQDSVVARGTGFEIKRSAVDQVVNAAKHNAVLAGTTLPANFPSNVLKQMINIKMLTVKATDADREQAKERANQDYETLLKQVGSKEELDKRLNSAGMTVAEMRIKLFDEAIAKTVLLRELNTSKPEEIASQAPIYLEKLRAELNVEVLDPGMK